MPFTLLKQITQEKYTKATIQALASQVNIGLTKFDDDFQTPYRHGNLITLVASVMSSWCKIEPTFDCKFPPNFIESAIYAYCGDSVKDVFHNLGLCINIELASELKKWLSE